MSPASRAKSKDKKSGKEPQKALSKPSSGTVNGGSSSSIPASAYNPLSGTFHTLETVPTSATSPIHNNGRFRNIDETDDQFGGAGGVEYDSVSNNGSWSGDSEDHHKEKTSNTPARQDATIPGAADNDKREKIRQKNERKHQRQKERRAQELHERCSGYLMSRKLEALAQQLVAMGFSHERATMALILNEGKVEESVSWLFEVGEDADDKHRDQNLGGGGNLKIDISDELARIADLEVRYKCTKQEVERAVVGSEGDLDKAAESLRRMKLDPPPSPPKPDETGDPPTMINSGKGGPIAVSHQNVMRSQVRPNHSQPSMVVQQRRDDNRDFNYTKAAVPPPLGGGASPEPGMVKNLQQPLNRIQPSKLVSGVVVSEKRWTGAPASNSNPSVSYSLSSPLQVSPQPPKADSSRYTPSSVGSEYNNKNFHPGGTTVREPVIMMQRPQPTVNTKQLPAVTSMSSSPPPGSACLNWYPANGIDMMKPSNGFVPQIPSNLNPSHLTSSNQMFHNHHLQFQQQQQQQQQQQHFIPGSSPLDTSRGGNGLWSNRTGAASTLAAASNLGLFSGFGSTVSSGASSPVDWSTASSMAQLDYTSIDWSLDRSSSSPRPNTTFCLGQGSLMNGATQGYDPTGSGLGAKLSMRATPSMNGVGGFAGLQDGGGVTNPETSAGGSHEWTSPFEGKDLFSLPRQFVSSPSL
ncbi:unnamed protein product [Linum trigynum]|uniref:UBA domain-containing protein n=1 Tax=Linum trigynum TaxID=586398 RepID=A0AAV2G0N1_9ROSI